jgi:ribosomal protein L37AE/L43A
MVWCCVCCGGVCCGVCVWGAVVCAEHHLPATRGSTGLTTAPQDEDECPANNPPMSCQQPTDSHPGEQALAAGWLSWFWHAAIDEAPGRMLVRGLADRLGTYPCLARACCHHRRLSAGVWLCAAGGLVTVRPARASTDQAGSSNASHMPQGQARTSCQQLSTQNTTVFTTSTHPTTST